MRTRSLRRCLAAILPACLFLTACAQWSGAGWSFRRTVTIDAGVVESRQTNFPLLVSISNADLRSAAHGGHVAQERGQDIVFTTRDGKTKLSHEIESYDPAAGTLVTWVKAPRLSADAATVFNLYYGNPSAPDQQDRAAVWDSHYRLVLHLSETDGAYADSAAPAREISRGAGSPGVPGLLAGAAAVDGGTGVIAAASAPALHNPAGITVEAWVNAAAGQAEGIRPIVSQWPLRETMDRFEVYDAGQTSGLVTRGFFGAVFDGRYVYFVPQYDGTERHGKVLRYDTQRPFRDAASWSAYDAGRTGAMNTKGYYGGAFDGRYIYFTPRLDVNGPHRRILRYDTQSEFTSDQSWAAHDAGGAVSQQGAIFDGRYVYFLPGFSSQGKSGEVLRYDTTKPFQDQASYTIHDASRTSGLETTDYDGGVFDGRYIYLSPLSTVPLRYDTTKEFTASASWEAFDAGLMDAKTCVGAVYDGRYVYYVPYGRNSVVVRFDTNGPFMSRSSWSGFRYPEISGRNGYDGGAFDGRYVYFLPFWDPTAPQGRQFHGVVLRHDTAGDFHSASSWAAHDAGMTSGLKTVGFNAGAFDGRYLYFAPWREESGPAGLSEIVPHGRVLRYDTVGAGASFSLRFADYGHNGGLSAALPGPTFLVNTDSGPIGVRANRTLAPGWRHLAGTYDGKAVRLYTDGVLAAEQAGSGVLQPSSASVSIGHMLGGSSGFAGAIDEVRISNVARSAAWLRAQYRNQSSPDAIRLGAEERAGREPAR